MKGLKIGSRVIDQNSPPLVIVEIGINHAPCVRIVVR